MNCSEYENIKHFTYVEYCDYLQEKQGIGKYDNHGIKIQNVLERMKV